MKQSARSCSLVMVVVSLVFILGCHNYYMATNARSATAADKQASIDSLKMQNRYFILRAGTEAYAMQNIALSTDQKTMTCRLDSLPDQYRLHLGNGYKGNLRYKKNDPYHPNVLNEVHIYTSDTMAAPGAFTLSLDNVQKIEVLQKDVKRTTNSYVIGAIGYTLGAAALAAIIVAATKSSCPFVSGYDGDQFVLQGEVFGGAIYPQLARHDYLPMKLAPNAEGLLQVKITNELKERQYTDLAELWVITHDENVRVLPDEKGKLYSIASPQPPIKALLGKKDVRNMISQADDNRVLYFDDTSSAKGINEVVLQFSRPDGKQKGKLLLKMKNSYFLDYLYGELAKNFGSYYARYMQQQRKRPAAELLTWVKEQRILLAVNVNTNAGWQEVIDITTVGPLANREMVVPLDLSAVEGDLVEVRLSSGFMFWEIDGVAMDFSADDDFAVEKLLPIHAVDETGKDVSAVLQKVDASFLEQPAIGNAATLTYKASSSPSSKKLTYIFHANGYYEHVREFTGKPNISFLKKFKHPDAFARFGMEQYARIKQQSNTSLMAVSSH